MNKKKILFASSILTFGIITAGAALFINNTNENYLAGSTQYKMCITPNKLKIKGEYANSTTSAETDLGNKINFAFDDCGYGDEKKIMQIKKNSGYFYNTDPLQYIQSIKCVFTDANKGVTTMNVGVGKTQADAKLNAELVNSDIVNNYTGEFGYFYFSAPTKAIHLKSFEITYDCKHGDEPINPSESSSESLSTSEVPSGLKVNSIATNNLTSGIIPTSYASSGVKFSKDDINLFANFITDDYSNGLNNGVNTFVLKQNQGYITNTNAINGLNTLTFNNAINGNDAIVYGSETFNGPWEAVPFNENQAFFYENHKFFKVVAGSRPFSFDSFDIVYKSSSSVNNEVYNLKDVTPISLKSEVDKLITVSSESFVNDATWTNLGYAKDINEAKNDALNKNQSGYDKETDYQLKENLKVVLNKNYDAYRVANMEYGDNGNSFRINSLNPNIKGPVIYKDCAYTYVEDIAAYITAFGDVPVNMRYLKNDSNAIRDWGLNGRTNYDYYSNNNTSGKYRYETAATLHRYFFDQVENQNNYWYRYYESDYGASVYNNEPYQLQAGYPLGRYNDGHKITRGSLRFVWSYSFGNAKFGPNETEKITNSYDRNVFFTNTHYNDFQQYLNYYGGWSLKFGNTTLGNGWGNYNKDNHLNEAPQLILVDKANL